ncbi:MAG: type II toxin-antitoxin system VapC family toxin [Ilumatobacteraceae bacterium]
MITYIDTSSFFKLLVLEDGTTTVEKLWAEADDIAAARLLQVEAHAALAQGRRLGHISSIAASNALDLLEVLWDEIIVVEQTSQIATQACELVSNLNLRALDAIHLASAIEVGASIVSSSDRRMVLAAQQIGLAVVDPLD